MQRIVAVERSLGTFHDEPLRFKRREGAPNKLAYRCTVPLLPRQGLVRMRKRMEAGHENVPFVLSGFAQCLTGDRLHPLLAYSSCDV